MSKVKDILNQTRVEYGQNGISDEYEEILASRINAYIKSLLPAKKDLSAFEGITATGGIDVSIDPDNEAVTGENLAYLAKFAEYSGFNNAVDEMEAKL